MSEVWTWMSGYLEASRVDGLSHGSMSKNLRETGPELYSQELLT